MKFLFALLLCVAPFAASAQVGPYYIYYLGFCNIKQVFINPTNTIYGVEVGCSASRGTPLQGFIDYKSARLYQAVTIANRICLDVVEFSTSSSTLTCSDGGRSYDMGTSFVNVRTTGPADADRSNAQSLPDKDMQR